MALLPDSMWQKQRLPEVRPLPAWRDSVIALRVEQRKIVWSTTDTLHMLILNGVIVFVCVCVCTGTAEASGIAIATACATIAV